jgi:hypothetical protein
MFLITGQIRKLTEKELAFIKKVQNIKTLNQNKIHIIWTTIMVELSEIAETDFLKV